jgi:hypothetical protein
MGRACSTDGGEEKCMWDIGGKADYWEDQGVGGSTILKWISER